MKYLVICVVLFTFRCPTFLCANNLAVKLNGIDDQVNIIQTYPEHPEFPANWQSVHSVTDKGEVYYVRGGDGAVFSSDDVPFPIKAMFTYQENCGRHRFGDIFFGTTNGVYLRKGGAANTTKIEELSDIVTHIQPYPDEFCTLHFITENGDVFNITGPNDTVLQQTDVPFPVTTMLTFTQDGGYHKTGDIFFGTTFGLYFRKANESMASRIEDIYDSIALIQEYPESYDFASKGRSLHVITKKGDIYYIQDGFESVEKETDVPFPVKTMYTFMENCGNAKVGDIYFGTTSGVYVRKAGEKKSTKIEGIDQPIKFFQEFTDIYCSVHIVTESGEIYKLRAGDKKAIQQTDVPLPIITMYTFTNDRGSRQVGDIYFGTTNGIYMRRVG